VRALECKDLRNTARLADKIGITVQVHYGVALDALFERLAAHDLASRCR
jgi:hypothetical protein